MKNIDTHFYDGKLPRGYRFYRRNAAQVRQTCGEILEKFRKMPGLSPEIRSAFPRAIALIAGDQRANYDNSDDIHAGDLLCAIWKLQEKKGLEPWMCEQIADIMGGQCPQGRVKRLYQIFCCIV